MHAAAPIVSKDVICFEIVSVSSFMDAVLALAGLPIGPNLVVFRLQAGVPDAADPKRFAESLYRLANLAADTAMISLCHVDGDCRGAALALALRCDVIAVTSSARMTASWVEPAAAAIHASASERIGAVTCERLLFDRVVDGPDAAETGLASFLGDFEPAVTRCVERRRTTHATARSSRSIWPFPMQAAVALAEPFASPPRASDAKLQTFACDPML